MTESISVELFPGAVWGVGCYLEGSRGWRNTGHLVEYAASVSKAGGDGGFTLDARDQEIVTAFMNASTDHYVEGRLIDVDGHVHALSDTALDYLNGLARAAAERGEPECYWGWEDGELMFSVVEEDEDA